MKRLAILLPILIILLFLASATFSEAARTGRGSSEFRAIGGVSMGAYGAMNIGLSYPGFFETIASLGGPLDMAYLLKYIEVDMLGNYDDPNPYPNRNTRIHMLQDLTISFGNPVYFNPDSTYFPPGITGANARVPTTLLDFKDGKYNPDGSLPVITYEDPSPGDWVKILLALDVNKDGKRNGGEPVLSQFHERFSDENGNGSYDADEPFVDAGLDGVDGTGDYGEGDGVFTYNPRRDNFMGQDPLTHASNLSLASLQDLNLYLDAGTKDEFSFNIHAENFVQTLLDRKLDVRVENGFPETFPWVSHFDEQRVYVRYEGGHVGVKKEDIGLSFEQAKDGVEGALVVANRFTTLFAFVSDHFPDGEYGTDPYEMLRYPSKMKVRSFYSPSLRRYVRYGIYLPPGYSRKKTTYYPVLYLLGGYKMSLEGMANAWMRAALDGLIVTKEMQKMIIVIPEGMNDKSGRGHFFVNQIDLKRGDRFMDSFFDLVNFIDKGFKTK
jgi:enterochelin esterase-like enzyme